MVKYTSYKSKGTKLWYWNGYVGTDPRTGKKVIKTRRGFTSKPAATDSYIQMRASFKQDTLNETDPNRLFEEIANDWLDEYKHTVQASTFVKVQTQFRLHILPEFGNKKIGKISIKDCQELVNDWYEDGYTKYREYKNNVSRVFVFAVNRHIVDNNPVLNIIVPRPKNTITEDEDVNFYEADELKVFLETVKQSKNEKAYAFLRLLAFTGIRKGEAIALNWSDIDFHDSTLRINKALSRGTGSTLSIEPPKTKASVRTLDIDPITLQEMKHWRTVQKRELLALGINKIDNRQLMFSNENNKFLSPAKPRKWIITNAEKAKLDPITVHGFRHTHASLLFESGVTIKEAQVRLGHADYQTTANIYTHVTKKMKMETGQKFAKYVNF
ncbi:tyrosine-type recombinase/integrase [Paucilactobacillus kaifaensis]|uniref:tyrosine-type recombinase/integrase n=1 Tax=Paucilactobacillus kaifaensis TaxID=2559921 RepID=UPI0010F73AC9|nr:site-specific integrase [Paucilactobacillus kaifaensis]